MWDRLPACTEVRWFAARAAGPAHIKPALAEPAVARNSAQQPHHRIAPAAWHGRHDILTETARAAQVAGEDVKWLVDNHYPEVYQSRGIAAALLRSNSIFQLKDDPETEFRF